MLGHKLSRHNSKVIFRETNYRPKDKMNFINYHLSKLTYKYSDYAIALTDELKKQMSLQYDIENIKVIYNPVNIKAVQDQASQSNSLKKDYFNITCCGYNEYLYKKILQTAYPDLFSLPVKNNLGLKLDAPEHKKYYKKVLLKIRRLLPNAITRVNPNLNYLDFNKAIREREDYKNIIGNNISDLKQRNLIDWIDIDNIWNEHQNNRKDYAKALILLASLEIYLKVKGDFE